MAEMPTLDSHMQPTIVRKPSSRARCSIRRPGVRPPALVSFTLMPWKKPAQRSTSSGTRQLSSAMMGKADSAKSRFIPAHSPAGSGCSMNSTPSAFSSGAKASDCSTDHAQFASTRNVAVVCLRSSRTMERSFAVPSLIL